VNPAPTYLKCDFFAYIAGHMKQHIIALLLLALTGLCFKTGDDALPKDKASFSATVDGKMFKLQDGQMLRGMLVNKSASMDGRTPAKTVINTNFNGLTYDKADKTSFSESVTVEMSFEDGKMGEPATYSVALEYNSIDYYMIKDQSKVKITQANWDDDKKHFSLSADIDCHMRSLGYPMDNKKDVALKGHMTNIKVTVPSWYAAKK
jgi:hypothetical protein